MTDYKVYDFVVGDILLYQGESYQVHENLGITGLVSVFPAADVELSPVEWNESYRKIGHEPLPAPTPCASGSCKPPADLLEFRALDEPQPIKFVEA